MFGKLLKHELRHTARYHFPILFISLGASIVMGITLLSKNEGFMLMMTLALLLVFASIIIISLIAVIKNFSDTIFSRQGYLTMTLPVKGNNLLASKIIVSFFWIIISYVAAFLPFSFVIIYIKQQLDAQAMTGEFMQAIKEILPPAGTIVTFVLCIVITSLISILSYVGYVYFSVTIANTRLLNKHPILFGGLVFIGVSIATSVITNLTEKIAPVKFAIGFERSFFTSKDVWELAMESNEIIIKCIDMNSTIIEAVVAVALLVVTGYFIEHKINIK